MSHHALRVYDSIIGLLSSEENPTPLVRLNRVVPYVHTRVFAKLEWYNPFGAIKDRVAANLIHDAEQRGELKDGQRLVEATSGNTGFGLAMMGNAKGYGLRTPLSAKIPIEKRTVLRFFGTDVVELDDTLCPAPGAPEGAMAMAAETAQTDRTFVLLNQYANSANPQSHYLTTGPEIWRQTEGRVTHFVAGLGTCGTITGTGRFLKERRQNIRVLGVHPEDGHDIPGVRSLTQLRHTQFFKPEEYDGIVEVGDRESFDMCLRLNREESIIAGPSSGMALVGALKLIADEPGAVVVVIFPDNIFKYASSLHRHFPFLFPTQSQSDTPTEGKYDQWVVQLLENLKNPHDTIMVGDLSAVLQNDPRPIIVDIRPANQYAESTIDGAINIPMDDFHVRSGELPSDRDANIVMLCGIGKFSKQTTLYLKSLGYRNVRSVKGGINEWARKGLPMKRPTAADQD